MVLRLLPTTRKAL